MMKEKRKVLNSQEKLLKNVETNVGVANHEDQKAITLIALVITIIVLLILAGVTINLVIGPDGLIEQSQGAVNKYEQAEVDEEKELENLLAELKEINSGLGDYEIEKVEPEDISEWEYTLDSETNTATLTKYLGDDTELVIPNYINGIPVKKVGGNTKYGGISSLWDESKCESNGLYQVVQKTITKITIAYGIEEIEKCFQYTESLREVNIPNSVTSIGGSAFYGCSSLASVTIPDSVTSIGGSAFLNCSSLASVTIPNSVTSIGESAFLGCSSLASVTIPDSVTSIGDYTFDGCRSLASVTIPNSVTSIGQKAFRECSNLTSIAIPNSVTSIGNYAFYGCSNLETVYFRQETAPSFENKCFYKDSEPITTFYFKSPTVYNAFTTSYYNSSYGTKSTIYDW